MTAPPPALVRRMQSAVDAAGGSAGRPSPETAVDAALLLLNSIIRDTQPSRTGALSLLAADALVTRAFEDAANAPDGLEGLGGLGGLENRAADAMRRIAHAVAENAP